MEEQLTLKTYYIFAEKVKSGEIMYEDTFGYYKNDEIILKTNTFNYINF